MKARDLYPPLKMETISLLVLTDNEILGANVEETFSLARSEEEKIGELLASTKLKLIPRPVSVYQHLLPGFEWKNTKHFNEWLLEKGAKYQVLEFREELLQSKSGLEILNLLIEHKRRVESLERRISSRHFNRKRQLFLNYLSLFNEALLFHGTMPYDRLLNLARSSEFITGEEVQASYALEALIKIKTLYLRNGLVSLTKYE